MNATQVRVGIIGCGMVAAEYATTLAASDCVRLAACADLDAERAATFAYRHSIPSAPVDDLLNPAAVDLAVVLTPPASHSPLARQAIAAGLPAVWVEKPIAVDPNDAAELIAHAAGAGTLLGVAPDTLLGPALQTAASALQRGLIGEIHSAAATLYSTGPERWHPAPEPFYAEHVGPLGDMGPYYLAALDHLLGPLHVRAATAATRAERCIRSGPRSGTGFTAHSPTYIAALLETQEGTPVTLTASFDSAGTRAPHLEIHGALGTLALPDPNFHTGDVLHRPYGAPTWSVVASVATAGPLGRGMGVVDLAQALHHGRSARCCPQRAERITRLAQTLIATATAHPPVPAQVITNTPPSPSQ
ncbi:Gfo/Idh/MocA family protein [Streptomyces nigrescens]